MVVKMNSQIEERTSEIEVCFLVPSLQLTNASCLASGNLVNIKATPAFLCVLEHADDWLLVQSIFCNRQARF